MKIVLFQSSSTQRVSVNLTPKSQSILLSKEWKKSKETDWILGKSIEIPYEELWRLKKVLEIAFDEREKLYEGKPVDQLFSLGCEVIQDE